MHGTRAGPARGPKSNLCRPENCFVTSCLQAEVGQALLGSIQLYALRTMYFLKVPDPLAHSHAFFPTMVRPVQTLRHGGPNLGEKYITRNGVLFTTQSATYSHI